MGKRKTGGNMRKIKTAKGIFLKTTLVFDTYWRFAVERQNIFMKRVKGIIPPWTNDPIIKNHRFTNVYRASDRVSQYLIKNVIYSGSQKEEDVVFRILLFKIFNKISTWENIQSYSGDITWKAYSFEKYSKALEIQIKNKKPIYSAAYIMPSPGFDLLKKYQNHLKLIEYMLSGSFTRKLLKTKSLMEVYKLLLSYPSLGKFLAFQFAIDFNYSELINFSEMDYVVAGPGAINGIRKCFSNTGGLTDEEIISEMATRSEKEFSRLGLSFQYLWGREPQLIDCQNLFCEVDKYSRVAHPNILGKVNRVKIKQKYNKCSGEIPQWYPPKWKLCTLENNLI